MEMSVIIDAEPEELLRQARAGSRTALGQLLTRYSAYLALLARLQIGRKLQGKADPADLVQEAFLAAHAHFARFRGTTEAEFLYWLRQILVAQLASLMRRYLGTKRRDVRLERELSFELDQSTQILDRGLLAAESTPSQHLAHREQAVLLAEAIARLPEDYREVIILRHLEELPFSEVAQRMARTVDSVEKLWLRALARLRRSMGGRP
jgi:RNA polymerase sigma-70 factor (ECF subfamily)